MEKHKPAAMSRLQEVNDAEAEKFMEKKVPAIVDEDELSDDEEEIVESLLDRIVALKVQPLKVNQVGA